MQSIGAKVLLFGVATSIVVLIAYIGFKYSTRLSGNLAVEASCFSSVAKLTFDNPDQAKTVYINGENTRELEIIWTGEETKDYVAYVEWSNGATYQAAQTAVRPDTCAEVPTPTPSQAQDPENVLGALVSPTISISPTKTPTPSVSVSVATNTPTATRALTSTPSPTKSPSVTATKTPTPTVSATKTPTPTSTVTQTPTPTKVSTVTPTPVLVASGSGEVKGEKGELPSTGTPAQSVLFIFALSFAGAYLYRRFRLI